MNKYLASLGVCVVIMAACGGTTSPNIDGGNDGGSGNDGTSGSDAPVSDSGGGPCDGGACTAPLSCCSNACVYEMNDPLNCGGCGNHCMGAKSMCLNGSCVAPTCQPACTSAQVCCNVPGPGPTQPPKCYDGSGCPIGCPLCQ
jgi:hypothetical protein